MKEKEAAELQSVYVYNLFYDENKIDFKKGEIASLMDYIRNNPDKAERILNEIMHVYKLTENSVNIKVTDLVEIMDYLFTNPDLAKKTLDKILLSCNLSVKEIEDIDIYLQSKRNDIDLNNSTDYETFHNMIFFILYQINRKEVEVTKSLNLFKNNQIKVLREIRRDIRNLNEETTKKVKEMKL